MSKINVAQGDWVKKGKILMQLDGGRTSLTAPTDGYLVKIDTKVGESIIPNTPLVWLAETQEKEIETYISESDISRVKLDNVVDMVFDAFPDETFTGKVVTIDTVETILDGVVHYRIKVQPDKQDERILSGFSANLSVITNQKKNVLLIPEYAISEHDGESFVQKRKDGKTEEKAVKIGKRDQFGNREILEGLQEGDQVEHGNSK